MLLTRKQLFLAILLANTYGVWPFEFEDAKQDGVTFGEVVNNLQTVYADENNNGGRINVVKITKAVGDISLETLTTNNKQFLPTIDDSSGETYIVTNRVDYEALVMKRLILSVTDLGDKSNRLLSVEVNNLVDENPIISPSTCAIPENLEVTVENSNCSYTVTDRDGWLNEITFPITNYGDLFEFKYKSPPLNTTTTDQVYLVLKDGQQLDYEQVTLYTFYLKAADAAGNPSIPEQVQIIVQVIDMPDMPPEWSSAFRSAMSIEEEQAINFTVTARDGDYGINNNISYSVIDDSGYVTIDNETGLVQIAPIDRDIPGNDEVTFIVVATEVEQPDSQTNGSITLFIIDIDDNIAVLTVNDKDPPENKELQMEILEDATEITIDVSANDIDLGENALYTVNLTADYKDFLSAFLVIPNRGYQETTLGLSITSPRKLDYEDENWRVITMELVTIGTKNSSHTDKIPITISLIDWNDEPPIFPEDNYNVSVREDVPKGYILPVTIQATDRDAEDIEKGVKHEILGTFANNILTIERFGGNVSTKMNKSFDYEKQTEVVVQIKASDNAEVPHVATTQLTINVIDVNDETPQLTISSTVSVEENKPNGTVLDSSIRATDEDTTADLVFSIDWDKSYATKNSRKLPDEIFEGIHCINIETLPGETNNEAFAKLTLIETQPDNTPDFEVYDSLYIYVEVTDLNQEINSGVDGALMVITIIDINDNPPIFNEGTNTTFRQVTENSPQGTEISSVIATDADVGSILTYSLEPVGDTPDWVAIDPSTGVLYVNLKDGEVLDCDAGPIYNLTYRVSVTDGLFNASCVIDIFINDQNDNKPIINDQSGSIQEDSQLEPNVTTPAGTEVIPLKYSDADRDEPYHTVDCRFAPTTSTDVTGRFNILNNVIVVDLSPGTTLDAEQFRNFSFEISCVDDPLRQGPISYTVIVKIVILIEDVNDNYPTIKNTFITGLTENSQGTVSEKLQGEDLDAGDNGLIKFLGITKTWRFLDNTLKSGEEISEDLFEVTTDDNQKDGILTIKSKNLRGFYGYLVLTIALTDLGAPPLSQEVDVVLEVQKYNFEEPIFKFPVDGMTYYLTPNQGANRQLNLWNLSPFPDIEVDDQQGLKYDFVFDVATSANSEDLFELRTLDGHTALLFMTTDKFEPQEYKITITATIDASIVDAYEASLTKDCAFTFKFFDEENTDPVFEVNEGSISIEENDGTAMYAIPNATYPDVAPNITEGLPIYYYLINGNDDYLEKFSVDKDSGVLTLLSPLDYESVTDYVLVIQASKNQRINTNAINQTRYTLTVNVIDVNDNAPVFDEDEYVGILNVAAGEADINIITVSATDLDTTSQGKLRFSIVSTKGSNDDLKSIAAKNPFSIDAISGAIKPRMTLSNTLRGYFTLTLKVEDEGQLSSEAQAIIYLVTAEHIVSFTFGNNQKTVSENKDAIKTVLDTQFANYNYITTVDTVRSPSSSDENRAIQNVYFVNSETQVPVPATEIYKQVTNVNTYNSLKQHFLENGLDLLSFSSETNTSSDTESILKAWLIGVSVVLGALCLLLLIMFVLKTRALNQRINNLLTTKYGSQESGLNRIGINAPTTNKHAVEGSNPIYNNELDIKDIDRRSVTSGDSGLIGVEDDEKFSYGSGSPENMTYQRF